MKLPFASVPPGTSETIDCLGYLNGAFLSVEFLAESLGEAWFWTPRGCFTGDFLVKERFMESAILGVFALLWSTEPLFDPKLC